MSLSDSIRILNFDDSLLQQKNLLERFHPTVVNLRAIGPECRIWMNEKVTSQIRAALDPKLKHSITFLGSGDFHQVSSLLIDQFEGPLSVIVFDHHPDWDILPPRLHCGSWVSDTLKRKNIQKVILLGVSSHDLSTFFIQSGNLDSLKDDRVEIYPYCHRPTRYFFKNVPQNKSIRLEGGILSHRIQWHELRHQNLTEFFFRLIDRWGPKRVYVSIDKDCLRARHSLTNWEEGCFELAELLTLLKLIQENLEIMGLDIAGDYSPPHVKGTVKKLFSAFDRPRNFTAKGKSADWISSVNEQTNLKILAALTQRNQNDSQNDQ